MDYGQFTDGPALRGIGRHLLSQFLRRFASELARQGVAPPADTLDDTEYYDSVSRLLLVPEQLPAQLHEALHAIFGMATPEGREVLARALAVRSGDRDTIAEMTNKEVAMRAWLIAPDVVAQEFSQARWNRLSRFIVLEATRRPCLPGMRSLEHLRNDDALLVGLDRWFAANSRGIDTAQVMCRKFNAKEWYYIRHGDTFARATKVVRRQFEGLHYRPAKDDLVVYCPLTNRLYICARTMGEAEAYRKAFGLYLKGDADYFEFGELFTLDPLRLLGVSALVCADVPGLVRVVLTRLKVELDGRREQGYTLQADDLFACAWPPGSVGLLIPDKAKLVRATFKIHARRIPKPIELHLIPPNILRLTCHAAAGLVQDWLSRRGFQTTEITTMNERETNEELVAMP